MTTEPALSHALAAHQQRALHLAAGAELRCRSGNLRLRFTLEPAGLVLTLGAGQAARIPVAQAVLVEATAATHIEVRDLQAHEGAPGCAQAQKNRQGLAGLWRWCLGHLPVRRGTRAA